MSKVTRQRGRKSVAAQVSVLAWMIVSAPDTCFLYIKEGLALPISDTSTHPSTCRMRRKGAWMCYKYRHE